MKAALVTGASQRLGKAIALGLAKLGYDIALHYRSSDPAATVTEIKELGVDCDAFRADLRDKTAIHDLVQAVHRRFPHLNTLINSASVFDRSGFQQTERELLDVHLDVNFKGPFFLTQSFADLCKTGNIINILDAKIATNHPAQFPYLLSKKVLADFTRMSALELAPGIRVNGVSPGAILPPEDKPRAYFDELKAGIPLGRTGKPENIVKTVIFLLDNDFVTGQLISVDGGETL